MLKASNNVCLVEYENISGLRQKLNECLNLFRYENGKKRQSPMFSPKMELTSMVLSHGGKFGPKF